MRKILILSSLLVTAFSAIAQDFSNKGKDFWVGYGSHCQMYTGTGGLNTGGGSQEMVLYFATEAVTNITVSIPILGYTQTYSNIAANTVFETPALPKTGTNDARLGTEGISNKGVHITSDKPVVAYAHVYNGSISGATILFPTNTLGKEYFSLNIEQHSNQAYSYPFFYVVATDTGTTTIEVTPSASTQTMVANTTYTYNLTQGQVFNALGTLSGGGGGNDGVDLSGSKIKSIASGNGVCKRIAVFSGAGKLNIKCPLGAGGGSADNYMVQCFPKSAWGKNFLTVPTLGMPYNFFRIAVTDPTTVVKVNNVIIGGLTGNFYYQLTQTNTPNYITADKPIMVAQYITTRGFCGNNVGLTNNDGDPEVIYLSPVEQNISKVLLYSTPHSAINSHYFNAILKNSGTAIGSFKLKNAAGTILPTNLFNAHPNNTAYSYLQQQLPGPGIYSLESDSGFNAIAYGFGGAESYGYNAGTNIKDLLTFITPINPLSISTDVTACTGTPFYFSVTLPKHPDSLTSLIWDYHGFFGSHNDTINAPITADSTYLIGTTQVWRYKLNHTHTFSPAGVYPITITAGTLTSEGCGNSVIIDRDLFVYDPPQVGFTAINNGCVTDSVRFTDTTTYAGTTFAYKWYWDFGDGFTSVNKNPKHLYATAGTYTIKYSVVSNVGCLSDTGVRTITVTDVPSAKFGMSSPICTGIPVTFSDTSFAQAPGVLTKWHWNFGDGFTITRTTGTDTTHIYNTWNPTVTDSLIVETNTGCKSPVFYKTFKVNPIPFVNFTLPPGICLPADSAHFFDASTIADATQAGFNYLWDFGDPTSGVNNSSGVKNPVHYYGTGGTSYSINLKVTSAAGCFHDTTKVLNTVYQQPHADFSVIPENCLNDVTIFTSNATGSGNTITEYHWDFGDATFSTLQSPTHTYLTAGTKTIKHWVVTDKGCYSDTTIKTVIINPLPTANFSNTGPFCETGTITFTDLSLANAGNITSWAWTFGDAGTSAQQNPTHTYASAGTYTVTLTVTTDKNCVSAVYSAPVVIHPLPVPGFTHTQACLPFGVTGFTNTSTVADATALSYQWDFGDPASGVLNTSTASNPSHYFSTTGPYTVTLTVTSAPGCINVTTQVISDIYAQAHADFTVNAENCLNDVTSFTSNATGSGSPIAQYHWDFGDATFSTLQNPTHTYLTAGTKTIKHWVVTDKSCFSDTTTHTVVINPLPTAAFTYAAPRCETRVITFTDVSVPNAGVLTNWAWDFGDGNTSTLQNPTHSFAAAGPYTVTLTVTTSKGCVSAVFTKLVIINPLPVAGFINPEVCLSDAFAQFVDTSHVTSGNIISWAWNFGDPASGVLNTSTIQNPQHRYNAIGLYTVTLTVNTDSGCIVTGTQSFTVNGDIPVSNFTPLNPATMCANDSVAIQDAATVNFGSVTKVEIYWDNVNFPAIFQTEDLPFPGKIYKHLYPNFQAPLTKSFTIRYRAYSGATCVNDMIKTIVVNAAPKVQFNNIPNICLDAVPYQITQASEIGAVPGSGVYSGPGVSPGGLFNPALTGPGTFTIKYTFTSTTGGCVDTLSKTITVYQPPVADFTFSTTICETKPITFTDASTTPVGVLTTWTWDFGDGTPLVVRNNNTPFTHVFGNWGNYNVTLKVTTSNGCVSVAKVLQVVVKPQPKPNFTFPASVCLPNAVIPFTNTSTMADLSSMTYLWNFGDPASGANSSTGVSPSHTYTSVGPFNVNLQVTSIAGCVHDTTIVLNVIHPQPKADFGINKPSVCIGDNVSFFDLSDGKDGVVNQWNWKFGDGLSDNVKNPVHLYGSTNTFDVSLYIVNSRGCNSDTITKQFTVHPYPVVNAGPDRVVLEGGSVILQATASGNDLTYLWTPASYLNDRLILVPVASNLLDDVTYTLTVTGRGGCAASDRVFVKLLKAPKIPNTFTPNNDGINDFWTIEYLDTYPNNRVQVFTRTGQLVFESKGYGKPWDGTKNGKPLPFDTYYYIVEPNNGRKPMTGYVTIVK